MCDENNRIFVLNGLSSQIFPSNWKEKKCFKKVGEKIRKMWAPHHRHVNLR